MVDASTGEAVTTIRIVNVPSYTNEADFNSWFLFAPGFEVATVSPARAPGASQTGWAKFESAEAAESAIYNLDGRFLVNCPEGTKLKVEWAKKNFKPSNPNKKRPHPDEENYSLPYTQPSHYSPVVVQPPPAVRPQPPTVPPPVARTSSTLFIGKLTSDVGEKDFLEVFDLCAGFERLKYVSPTEGKAGMCFAKFDSPENASQALQTVEGFALPSHPDVPLMVTFAKNDLDQPSRSSTSDRTWAPAPTPDAAPRKSWGAGGLDRHNPPYVEPYTEPTLAQAQGNTPCDTMFIGNLAPTVTEVELVHALATLPGFVRLKFVGEGTQKPMAFALFDSTSNCNEGIHAFHGNSLPAAPMQALICQYAKNSLDKPTPKYQRQV